MKIDVLWSKSDTIALALSGGVDSVVLFHLLVTKYKNSYHKLVIFHINHGLREESKIEENFIRSLAKKYNVDFYIKCLDLKNITRPNHISEEMLARELRYKSFFEMSKLENINCLLTAHHKNDNVENILMRLITGRGNSNLLIENCVEINGVLVKRPLINVLKEEIINYATENNIKYYEDTSNYNIEDYTRNYVRHKIVPNVLGLCDSSFDNLINFANNYKDINSFVSDNIDKIINELDLKYYQEKLEFNFNIFNSLSNLEKERILDKLIKKYFCIYDVSKKSLKDVVHNINSEKSSFYYDLKQNLKIIKEYQSISICKNKKKCYNDKIEITEYDLCNNYFFEFQGKNIEISSENNNAEIGFNKIDLPILITTQSSGDKIKRGNITKKISRLFIDMKIPASVRKTIPILKNKNKEILGILDIGSNVGNKKKYDYYVKISKG